MFCLLKICSVYFWSRLILWRNRSIYLHWERGLCSRKDYCYRIQTNTELVVRYLKWSLCILRSILQGVSFVADLLIVFGFKSQIRHSLCEPGWAFKISKPISPFLIRIAYGYFEYLNSCLAYSWKWKWKVVSDSVTLWTVANQSPLSIGFSRQEYWSSRSPSLGDLPDPGIEPSSALQADLLLAEPQGSH